MVERTVYVGATLQVMVRFVTGAQLQASVTNTGSADGFEQGAPVSVHVPADALRLLGPDAPTSVDPDAAVPDEGDVAAEAEPSQSAG